MKRLTVILGAGFSANAGMPLASTIATRFNRDQREKLLKASSGEWLWIDDKSETDIHNASLNFDRIVYSYVLNEIVIRYKKEHNNINNYEDFYQFIIDNYKNKEWVQNVFDEAKKDLIDDKPFLLEEEYKLHLFIFDTKQFSIINEIINYLIADFLVNIPKNDEELKEIYLPFINYIKEFDEVHIFTLNHDLLLEKVLDLFDISYSNGFTTENSPILHNDIEIPYFNNKFEEKVRIYKLHGSIDYYQFHHLDQTGPTYFQTRNYYTKHDAVRIDPISKKVIQDFSIDITPKFITGTDKVERIMNDSLFKDLYQKFEDVIETTSDIFISGYSFSDEHINEKLSSKNFNYINHARTKKYPFKGTGKNITSFDEI